MTTRTSENKKRHGGWETTLTEPGTYRVSLGGNMAYLGTTVCSNMAEVKIGSR
jgi:hypothetical protein